MSALQRPLALALVAVALVACATGCAGRRGLRGAPRAEDGDVGVYRVRAQESGGKPRRFKLLLWAALPDRLHGEIVAPVGGTVVIFDGGNGDLAVSLVRDRLAFVGPGRADALGRIFGVRLTLEELVTGLLTGEGSRDEHSVTRRPATGQGLPERLDIREGQRSVSLELHERRRLPATAEVGSGRPTAGFEVRPLESLALFDIPLDPPDSSGAEGPQG